MMFLFLFLFLQLQAFLAYDGDIPIEETAHYHNAFNANHELLLAAREGKVHRIKQVIEHGAYIEARNNNGVSALILAANNGHLDAVKFLLQYNADIDATSNDGRTPLIWAAMWGHFDVVKLLIQRGAYLDVYDADGMTPLMSATLTCNTEMVNFLIDLGAEVASNNFHGGNALSIGRSKKCVDIVEILEPYFANVKRNAHPDPYVIAIGHALDAVRRCHKLLIYYFRRFTGLYTVSRDDL